MERHQAIKLVSNLVVSHEGWIVDHQLFSNVSANVRFELPGNRFDQFREDLFEAGLTVRTNDELTIDEDGDVPGTISFTFIHNEPDMKRDVPAFG